MRRFIFNFLLILTLASGMLAFPEAPVKAQSNVSAGDLIALVNSIRGAYGLPALVENSILNSECQWTAEEMASINASTHLAYLGYSGASERAVDWGFGSGKLVFVTENWYGGYTATLGDIESGWADELHMYPMTKAEYVYVGAGVATASNGMTYYVLQAGYISGEEAPTSSGGSSSGSPSATQSDLSSEWLAAVYTTTPSADGMIYHKVQANQTLFYIALAYNVTTDYLVELNGLDSADDIYEGQLLKIMDAPTPTPTATFTVTPDYPTRTPTSPMTPTPAFSPTPTPKPPLIERLPKFDRGSFGFLLVIISAIGLAAVLFINFFKPKQKSPPAVVKEVEKETPSTTSAKVRQAPVKKPTKKVVKSTEKPQAHMPKEIPIKTSRRTTKK
jgi:LysM repeat protein